MFGKNVKFVVLPNAIDTDAYVFSNDKRILIRKELGLPENAFVIGHVGRFSKVKNHRFIIELCELVLKQNRNTYVLFVGQGDLLEETREIVMKKHLENVIKFLGLRNDVPDLMQAMDVFVFPSLYEGLPVTMVEAQAAGLPCVISDKVPDECIVTEGLVTVQKLSDSAENWAKHVVSRANMQRKDTGEQIKAHGFDIAENAKWLEEFYLKHG